jgi:hypothetical protein
MTSKLSVVELKKRLRNVEKKREELGCNDRFIPMYNTLDCIRLKKTKERTEKQIALKNAAKKAVKKSDPAKKSESGRPRGRPPMACEDISKKTKIKDPVKKQAAVDKKCAKRASKSYPPYKCTNVDGKCMTISKTYKNPLFDSK